jgi:hypothetical protein
VELEAQNTPNEQALVVPFDPIHHRLLQELLIVLAMAALVDAISCLIGMLQVQFESAVADAVAHAAAPWSLEEANKVLQVSDLRSEFPPALAMEMPLSVPKRIGISSHLLPPLWIAVSCVRKCMLVDLWSSAGYTGFHAWAIGEKSVAGSLEGLSLLLKV